MFSLYHLSQGGKGLKKKNKKEKISSKYSRILHAAIHRVVISFFLIMKFRKQKSFCVLSYSGWHVRGRWNSVSGGV